MSVLKPRLRRGLILLAATTFVLSVPMTVVQAALVNHSFVFTGNLDPDPVFGSVPVTGSFQLTTVSGSSSGVYYGAVTGFNLNILTSPPATYTSPITPGAANDVTILRNSDLGGGVLGDRWKLTSAATGDRILDGTEEFTPVSFELRLDRVGGGLFSDTSLQDPPTIGALNSPPSVTGRWRLLFEGPNQTFGEYVGSIASLTAVPLPAAGILFGIGLISLVGLGAGRMRNLQGSQA